MARLTLQDARALLGWSQGRLSDESGIKKNAISDIECGRNQSPGYVTVMRLVRALQRGGLTGVSAEDIFPVPEHDSNVKAAS